MLIESWRTIYLYFDFGLKSSSFRLHYQRPSSSADCAKSCSRAQTNRPVF